MAHSHGASTAQTRIESRSDGATQNKTCKAEPADARAPIEDGRKEVNARGRQQSGAITKDDRNNSEDPTARPNHAKLEASINSRTDEAARALLDRVLDAENRLVEQVLHDQPATRSQSIRMHERDWDRPRARRSERRCRSGPQQNAIRRRQEDAERQTARAQRSRRAKAPFACTRTRQQIQKMPRRAR
jgi:hypothetical protein